MKYSVIMPVYNERDNLPTTVYLLEEVALTHKLDIQIIIVEDNSTDGTRQIAEKLLTIFANIKLVKRPKKMGLGSAYCDALSQCQGDFIIIMDADFSHHPKYIPAMITKQAQSKADIVTSTRYVQGGGVEGWTFMRKLTSRVANFITSTALGSQFSDLTGSYRLYKKQVFEELIKQITTKGYSFQMQILIRAWKNGKKIEEVPIVFVDRIYGSSKLGTSEIITYLKGTLTLFMTY